MALCLPNEIHLLIGNYVYNNVGIYRTEHSQYSIASKTTKNIMDLLAKKDGYESYLSRSLYFNNRCSDCYKALNRHWPDFFDKNYKLCRLCNSKRPKLSPTQVTKDYLLKPFQFEALPFFATRNQYRVYCRYFLQSDVEDLQRTLYTQEQINQFYHKKQLRIQRRTIIGNEKNSRAREIRRLLESFSGLTVTTASNSEECVKYVQKGVPKNAKKKTEFVESLLAFAKETEENPPVISRNPPRQNHEYSDKRTQRYHRNRW